jgi:hypothetical protein
MDCNSRRLIENHEPLVLANDGASHGFEQARRDARRRAFRLDVNRGYPHHVAGLQPQLRLRAFAVHAHFAATHDAIHATARNAWKKAHEELVETPSRRFRIDLYQAHAMANSTLLWPGHLNLIVRYCFYSGLASILAPAVRNRTRQWLAALEEHPGAAC